MQCIDYTAYTVFISFLDVHQMQSQKKMHQEVQHPEVPSGPRTSYPFLTSLHFNISRKQRDFNDALCDKDIEQSESVSNKGSLVV